MAARRREFKNRYLPDYLYHDPTAGYRFKLIDGTRASLGHDRTMAIAIAKEYNQRMRPAGRYVEKLIRPSGGKNGEYKPLGQYVDKLVRRIIDDESPAGDSKDTLMNDAERAKEFFADVVGFDITLDHVNAYINRYHGEASANVQNRKVSWLKKLFGYAMDESLMDDNPASRKRMRKTASKERRRLTLDQYKLIHAAAPLWLQTAMDLALQTTHARLEVSRIRYNIKSPSEGKCGCVWFDEPKNGIYGVLYIHRQKVEKKEASHVAIPIGNELKRIIDQSRDNVMSPFVVHRLPERKNKLSKEVSHRTQLTPDYISRAFSDVRDQVGVAMSFPTEQKPTFHEIRALAAHLIDQMGINPQARMAHTDAESTKVYTANHVQWVEVPHVEIVVGM